MLAMNNLQTKVNDIAKQLDGIDDPQKLERAKQMARQDNEVQGLLLEILDEALSKRWISDTNISFRKFLGMPGK